ncbi:uncharacterized protein EI97DRAFT_20558 [Westerdykella ornata]|uniref:Uncharacterized protein n=1 Tax=Westerdykella ornata TaxID=318751 RepID=A0A6A6K183_WESOR|nr:uncharacterized protein EI97DRAFT_20558 [Westerdykella ornata]KAF2281119.1 hypothetical protein EI97DRAFT_20558 [Westerdykella ornata]
MTHEKEQWKWKAESYAKQLETLQKRHKATLKSHSALRREAIGRTNMLELENRQLKAENAALKGKLTEMERENAMLTHVSNTRSNKLRGANKKARKEKRNASKESEKAKTAVDDENTKLKAGRNWRKDLNEALAALAKEKKLTMALSDELDIEKSGKAHMREDGTDQDDTTVVIPIEFKIYRGDFHKLAMLFEANRIKTTEQYELWYMLWKKAQIKKKKLRWLKQTTNRLER